MKKSTDLRLKVGSMSETSFHGILIAQESTNLNEFNSKKQRKYRYHVLTQRSVFNFVTGLNSRSTLLVVLYPNFKKIC